jgi:hypothetical protein
VEREIEQVWSGDEADSEDAATVEAVEPEIPREPDDGCEPDG